MYVFLYTKHGFMGIAYTQNTIESEGSEIFTRNLSFPHVILIYKSSWIWVAGPSQMFPTEVPRRVCFLFMQQRGGFSQGGTDAAKQQSWICQLTSELVARALCKLRWEIVYLPYSFSVVWNSKLCDEETRWEEKETLWKAYVCLRNEESLRKREKTNSFPRDWCLRARPRLNGSFYIFQLGKASALFPLSPTLHCDVEFRKKVQKMKTACVIAAPNMLRGELDTMSHKNATNTLNGLRVILFSYLHFVIFTAAEGWTSIFREMWGAQVTNGLPLRSRSYNSTRPRSIMNQSTLRGRS